MVWGVAYISTMAVVDTQHMRISKRKKTNASLRKPHLSTPWYYAIQPNSLPLIRRSTISQPHNINSKINRMINTTIKSPIQQPLYLSSVLLSTWFSLPMPVCSLP